MQFLFVFPVFFTHYQCNIFLLICHIIPKAQSIPRRCIAYAVCLWVVSIERFVFLISPQFCLSFRNDVVPTTKSDSKADKSSYLCIIRRLVSLLHSNHLLWSSVFVCSICVCIGFFQGTSFSSQSPKTFQFLWPGLFLPLYV